MDRAAFIPGRVWPLYKVDEEAFESSFIAEAADFVRHHPLLAGTTLNARFSGTEGFSIALTRSGLPRLEKTFPLFHHFLERVGPDQCNAFFINPLCIASGAHVAPHIDRSLNTWTRPEFPPFPVKVSVLYLHVPDDLEGGLLRLWTPAWHLGPAPRVTPSTGKLFEFRGDLRHEVAEVKKASTPRISLVMENYCLPPYLLRKIPEFYTKSSKNFEAILEESLSV